MKEPTFDTSKSLEQLENDYWSEPSYSSYLVKTCHELRKKRLSEFTNEDFRIMIGQNIGLKYLIPLVSLLLKENILTEGDMYEGDILTNVLKVKNEYWQQYPDIRQSIIDIVSKQEHKLESFDTLPAIKEEWFTLFSKLKTSL